MKQLLLLIILSQLFSEITHGPTGWTYQQSTLQSFFMCEYIDINREAPEPCNNSNHDYQAPVTAFD